MVQCGSMGFSEAIKRPCWLLVAAWLGAVAAADVEMVDVLVYSANAAGVGAAVTASNNSKFKVKVSLGAHSFPPGTLTTITPFSHTSLTLSRDCQVMEPLEMIGGMAAAGGVALMNQVSDAPDTCRRAVFIL